MDQLDAIGTHFTTADGIYTFSMDRDEVTIKFHPDIGQEVELSIPAWKFAWVVRDWQRIAPPK